MISSSVTNRTVIVPLAGLDNKPGPTETAFEMGGQMHSFVLDGRVEDSISQALLDKEKAFTSLDQLTSLCKDEKGGVAKAQRLIADGAETVKVDVGQAEKWTAKATDKPGVIELTNEGGLYGNEQSIRISGDYISLTSRPAFTSGKDESVTQKIVGKFNAGTGTITCVREEIERTLTQEAPAPLPKPVVEPCLIGPGSPFEPYFEPNGAQPIPEPMSTQPAANRPGEVSSGEVDAKVFEPVAKELGDSALRGFTDERLARFADWALGQTDTCYPSALAALPQGWEDIGNLDSYSKPGDNYMLGNRGGQFQVLNVDAQAGTVSLLTQHNYRQPGDFEGSHDEVVLTRYKDGEIRRQFSEMHD